MKKYFLFFLSFVLVQETFYIQAIREFLDTPPLFLFYAVAIYVDRIAVPSAL